MSDIWALILAAGQSKRMGEPKLLLPVPEGSLLKRALQGALDAGNCRVAVVVARQGPVKQVHLEGLPVYFIESEHSELGLGASLAAGLAGLIAEHSPQAVIILLGDQPDLDSRVIRRVAEAYQEHGGLIVQACYSDRPAHPVLFDKVFFPELLALSGDNGAKELLRKHKKQTVYVDAEGKAPQDIDTPEEYRDYIQSAGSYAGRDNLEFKQP